MSRRGLRRAAHGRSTTQPSALMRLELTRGPAPGRAGVPIGAPGGALARAEPTGEDLAPWHGLDPGARPP